MSFNDDYWLAEPGLWSGGGTLPNRWSQVLSLPLLTGAVVALATIVAIPSVGLRLLVLLLLAGLLLLWVYRRILQVGMEPFPTAPRTDLPSILKALYRQQKFIGFMIANQGLSAPGLQRNLASFVRKHQPDCVESPSQVAGCILS
ncbi:MAG: hypothetical protein VKK97_05785 [Synechococcaceae cyanobacterium]|nr:hypothetical protein [Synechococcaceae cyanobacterium]